MYTTMRDQLTSTLEEIRNDGLFKNERPIESSQSVRIVTAGRSVLNFCANNYLGLADDPAIINAATDALQRWGFGLASVRFICGTQTLHRSLEKRVSEFLGMDDTIVYSSCFDANGGIFETLFSSDDAIISDELNHASIIDGIRLSKARRFRYANCDLVDLRWQLEQAAGARQKVIVTDGVFSMDGSYAPLAGICDLAEEFGALVMVDDSHAVGLVGDNGRGTPERAGVEGRIDILSGTFGKALGGASGGYISAHSEIVALLRQRSRPYLFSNSVPPVVIAGTLAALELTAQNGQRRRTLHENARLLRSRLEEEGFTLLPGEHPIIPVMFEDAGAVSRIAEVMLSVGVFVTAFSYPVVPRGKARIRVQVSAAHSSADIEACVQAFLTAADQVLDSRREA